MYSGAPILKGSACPAYPSCPPCWNWLCEWRLTHCHYRGSCCSRHRQWVCDLILPRSLCYLGLMCVLGGSTRSRSALPHRPLIGHDGRMPTSSMGPQLPAHIFGWAPKTMRNIILMNCALVRVCVRPVSPVTTHPELSSVSPTPQNWFPLQRPSSRQRQPPTLASDDPLLWFGNKTWN
jgi:hypothetical protein